MNKLNILAKDASSLTLDNIVALLHGIRDHEDPGVHADGKAILGRAMHAFLNAFCDPAFTVPDHAAMVFIQANTLIANVMSMLDTTTDPWITTLHGQPQQGFKTMVLYSARNDLEVDLSGMLDQNPGLVSQWLYHTFQVMFSGAPSRKVVDKLRSFIDQVDERLEIGINLQEAYFLCTALGDINAERRMKNLINQACRRALKHDIRIDPDPTKIAVWAEFWSPGHSVYRSLRDYVAALKPDHHLTLIHSTRKTEELDTSLFDEVVRLDLNEKGFDLEPLKDWKFAAAVFCDVGMTMPSILLSNVRIAPVQILMTGHPVSTFGGEMDWFVSGELVEDPRVYGNDRFYTEKLLSLPGYGATHAKPTYVPKGRKKEIDAIIINCSWLGQKCHYECLEALNRAVARSGRKVLVRMFPGQTPLMHKGAHAFTRDVQKLLPSPRVEIFPMLPYAEYMELLEEGDFAADAFPFGGSNTASDMIHLGIPVVAMRGHRWFSRIGPTMYDQFAGQDPIETIEEYEERIYSMIVTPGLIEYKKEKMKRGNPDAVYNADGPKELNAWIRKAVGR